MKRPNTNQLYVNDLTGTTAGITSLPRRYTLTHSDLTRNLFLTIGDNYDKKQISRLYTRLIRDEILAELVENEDHLEFRIYCHVSGGLVFGTAKWRSDIFHVELPPVIEAIRFGDRNFFETHPILTKFLLVYIPVLTRVDTIRSRIGR